MRTGQRVLEYLDARGGETHIMTICNDLKISRMVMVSSLQWLVETNKVLRTSRGVYTTSRTKKGFAPKPIEAVVGSSIPPIPMSRLMGQRA